MNNFEVVVVQMWQVLSTKAHTSEGESNPNISLLMELTVKQVHNICKVNRKGKTLKMRVLARFF